MQRSFNRPGKDKGKKKWIHSASHKMPNGSELLSVYAMK